MSSRARLRFHAGVWLGLWVWLISLGAAAAEPGIPLRIGISAYRPLPVVNAEFQPVADALARDLGRPVELRILPPLDGQADIALIRTGLPESMIDAGELAEGQLQVIAARQSADFPLAHSTRPVPEWMVLPGPQLDLDQRGPQLAGRSEAAAADRGEDRPAFRPRPADRPRRSGHHRRHPRAEPRLRTGRRRRRRRDPGTGRGTAGVRLHAAAGLCAGTADAGRRAVRLDPSLEARSGLARTPRAAARAAAPALRRGGGPRFGRRHRGPHRQRDHRGAGPAQRPLPLRSLAGPPDRQQHPAGLAAGAASRP